MQYYKVLSIHIRKIKKLCQSFDNIGLKKANYDPIDGSYHDYGDIDFFMVYCISDKIKFDYSLMKYPELYQLLHKVD